MVPARRDSGAVLGFHRAGQYGADQTARRRFTLGSIEQDRLAGIGASVRDRVGMIGVRVAGRQGQSDRLERVGLIVVEPDGPIGVGPLIVEQVRVTRAGVIVAKLGRPVGVGVSRLADQLDRLERVGPLIVEPDHPVRVGPLIVEQVRVTRAGVIVAKLRRPVGMGMIRHPDKFDRLERVGSSSDRRARPPDRVRDDQVPAAPASRS